MFAGGVFGGSAQPGPRIKPPKNGYGESNAIAYLPPERGAVARAAKPTPAAPATPAAPPKMASAPWNKKG